MIKQFRVRRFDLLLLALLFPLTLTRSDLQSVPRLFARYEHGIAYNRITETVVALEHSIRRDDREVVAIRVCSKERMPFALATANGHPFLIADLLKGIGYPSDSVVFLRSEDCLSKTSSKPATEIWAIPQRAALPSHAEALKSSNIELIPLGEMRDQREMSDYAAATRKLIEELRAESSSAGVIVGYFLHKPSPALRRRIREVTRTLSQNGIPRNRYVVEITYWPDEVSEYPPDREPKSPNVFIIKLAESFRNDRKHPISRVRDGKALIRRPIQRCLDQRLRSVR